MCDESVSFLAGESADLRVDAAQPQWRRRALDGSWIEVRLHAGELIVLAFEAQRRAGCEGGEDGAQCVDVVAHATHRFAPWHRVAALDVLFDLGAEAEL